MAATRARTLPRPQVATTLAIIRVAAVALYFSQYSRYDLVSISLGLLSPIITLFPTIGISFRLQQVRHCQGFVSTGVIEYNRLVLGMANMRIVLGEANTVIVLGMVHIRMHINHNGQRRRAQ